LVSKLEIAGKGTLFAVAISVITAGTRLITTDFYAGLACLVAGIALVVVWAVLIDYQARKEASETVKRLVREMEERKLERKRYSKSR